MDLPSVAVTARLSSRLLPEGLQGGLSPSSRKALGVTTGTARTKVTDFACCLASRRSVPISSPAFFIPSEGIVRLVSEVIPSQKLCSIRVCI